MHIVQWFFCCFGALVFLTIFAWLLAVCLMGFVRGSADAASVWIPSELGRLVVGGGR